MDNPDIFPPSRRAKLALDLAICLGGFPLLLAIGLQLFGSAFNA